MMELKTDWEKKAEVKSKVDSICLYLNTKFGESSVSTQQKVSLIRDIELLDQTSKKIFTTNSLEEALTVMNRPYRNKYQKILTAGTRKIEFANHLMLGIILNKRCIK